MSETYTGTEVIPAVERLKVSQLRSFVEAEIVTPKQAETGLVFREVDLVRLEMPCKPSEEVDLHLDAPGIVISLIDQLYGVRGSLRAVPDAVEREPEHARSARPA